jgi:hypothetical protein
MIGAILIGVGVLDFIIGHFVVVPRVPKEEMRPKIRAAIAAASLLTIGLGASFLVGWLGGV